MDIKKLIKQIVESIDQDRPGLPVLIADVRNSVTCPKPIFDKIILGLAKSRKYFLNRHFYPITMTKQEKEDAVFDNKDNYYIYIIKR
jgi:hypothetical protein